MKPGCRQSASGARPVTLGREAEQERVGRRGFAETIPRSHLRAPLWSVRQGFQPTNVKGHRSRDPPDRSARERSRFRISSSARGVKPGGGHESEGICALPESKTVRNSAILSRIQRITRHNHVPGRPFEFRARQGRAASKRTQKRLKCGDFHQTSADADLIDWSFDTCLAAFDRAAASPATPRRDRTPQGKAEWHDPSTATRNAGARP